ncbi:AAA family ATPase [Parapusillimonas sp. SGNA-6]|nr:AAA family ATPase [Parapusillimonas sp. SGNA-6]
MTRQDADSFGTKIRKTEMLAGLFLRHYKIYKNINFIPITHGPGLTAYLGRNGSGKSSVLDALDKYFNGGDWSINAYAKREGGLSSADKLPYIVPVFVIEKGELSQEVQDTAEIVSSYLWNTKLKTTTDALPRFYALRKKLSENGFSENEHYLLAIGRQHNKSTAYLGSFHTDPELIAELKQLGDETQIAKSLLALLDEVRARYAYFYIPVEADPTVFSKLESLHVQKLLDQNIQDEIKQAISAKTINEINASLQSFIDEINQSLGDYKYKGTFKDKLTMNDLIEKVFEAYFSIKVLHKDSGSSTIPIREMSAGEKRRALIDLSYSLLRRKAARSHNVILAIDEPDASLHSAACHDQFVRLSEIPNLTTPRSQVIITTHWYGFLPIVQNGIAHSISQNNEKIEFFSFDLLNYREQIRQTVRSTHGELPKDVELKSYNDMLQAIVVSVVRPSPFNWILCEGLSDQIYLNYYFRDLIDNCNLRIVPLGGFKEVRRAFDYLKVLLNDPEYQGTGKVLCLVDTDAQLERGNIEGETKSLAFLRLIYDERLDNVTAVKMDDQRVSPPTEIENALEAHRFILAAQAVAGDRGGATLTELISSAQTVSTSVTSYGYLNLSPAAERQMKKEYFDVADNKVAFAKAYVAVETETKAEPKWVNTVRHFFAPQSTATPKTAKHRRLAEVE